jgi:hypothetical protein
VPEFEETAQGRRLATSIGRGADRRGGDITIIIDDPLKPEATNLHDFTVCTSWRIKGKDLHLLHVLRFLLLWVGLLLAPASVEAFTHSGALSISTVPWTVAAHVVAVLPRGPRRASTNGRLSPQARR